MNTRGIENTNNFYSLSQIMIIGAEYQLINTYFNAVSYTILINDLKILLPKHMMCKLIYVGVCIT